MLNKLTTKFPCLLLYKILIKKALFCINSKTKTESLKKNKKLFLLTILVCIYFCINLRKQNIGYIQSYIICRYSQFSKCHFILLMTTLILPLMAICYRLGIYSL